MKPTNISQERIEEATKEGVGNLKLNTYQRLAHETALPYSSVYYPFVGLAGEAGEIANKIKKSMRGDVTFAAIKQDLISELGDVLWYIQECANCLGVDLEEVAVANIVKLADRHQRGVVRGNGDNR